MFSKSQFSYFPPYFCQIFNPNLTSFFTQPQIIYPNQQMGYWPNQQWQAIDQTQLLLKKNEAKIEQKIEAQEESPQEKITNEKKERKLSLKVQNNSPIRIKLRERKKKYYFEEKVFESDYESLRQSSYESDPENLAGHWTPQEQQIYEDFILRNQNVITSKFEKKSRKIFKMMSYEIKTRTPAQCRSHHQKFNPFQSLTKKRIKQVEFEQKK